jgi:hypothetical protein
VRREVLAMSVHTLSTLSGCECSDSESDTLEDLDECEEEGDEEGEEAVSPSTLSLTQDLVFELEEHGDLAGMPRLKGVITSLASNYSSSFEVLSISLSPLSTPVADPPGSSSALPTPQSQANIPANPPAVLPSPPIVLAPIASSFQAPNSNFWGNHRRPPPLTSHKPMRVSVRRRTRRLIKGVLAPGTPSSVLPSPTGGAEGEAGVGSGGVFSGLTDLQWSGFMIQFERRVATAVTDGRWRQMPKDVGAVAMSCPRF